MTQLTIHLTERYGTQAHLDANRERFTGQLLNLYNRFMNGEKLTALDAMSYGIMRLASRVNELRKAGFEIKSEWVQTGQTKSKLYYAEIRENV